MLMAPQPRQLWLGLVMSAAMLMANSAVVHQSEKGRKWKGSLTATVKSHHGSDKKVCSLMLTRRSRLQNGSGFSLCFPACQAYKKPQKCITSN